jgi:hypothetical protein
MSLVPHRTKSTHARTGLQRSDLPAAFCCLQVLELAELCACPPEAAALWELAAEDNYRQQVGPFVC